MSAESFSWLILYSPYTNIPVTAEIKINKIAVDGKANKAIVEYLSELLEVPKSNISITKGEKTSLKDLQIVPKSPII